MPLRLVIFHLFGEVAKPPGALIWVEGDDLVNDRYDFGQGYWLHEIAISPGGQASEAIVGLGQCGEDDERYIGRLWIAPQRTNEMQAIQMRHQDIGNDAIRPQRDSLLQGRHPISGTQHREAAEPIEGSCEQV